MLDPLLGLLVVETLGLLLGEEDPLKDLQVVTCEFDGSFSQRLLAIRDIEYRVQHLLYVELDEGKGLLDLHQLKLIFDVLMVNVSAEPEHGNDAGQDEEDIIHGKDIGDKRQLDADELEELQQEENGIEEVEPQEGGAVDEDAVHVLSSQVHQAHTEEEPGMKRFWAQQVDRGQ